MNTVMVHVHVQPERVEDFIAATLENRKGSVNEPGNVRFDLLQSEEDRSRFVLLEIYRSTEDAAAHKETAHYLRWRETVAGWMASPRKGVPYLALAPGDPEAW